MLKQSTLKQQQTQQYASQMDSKSNEKRPALTFFIL